MKKTKNGLEIQSFYYKETFLISLTISIMMLILTIPVIIFQNDELNQVVFIICLVFISFLVTIFFALRFNKCKIIINDEGVCQKFLFKQSRIIAWEDIQEYGYSPYRVRLNAKYHSPIIIYALYFSDKKIGLRENGGKNAKAESKICLLVEKRDIINGFLRGEEQRESIRKYCKRYTRIEPYLDKEV